MSFAIWPKSTESQQPVRKPRPATNPPKSAKPSRESAAVRYPPCRYPAPDCAEITHGCLALRILRPVWVSYGIAGVEPWLEKLNGHDATALIVSANLARRNLTKGQKAMALAMIYPEPERGRGKIDAGKKGAETASFSYRRLAQARSVLAFSPELARAVIAGREHLDAALAKVQEETKRLESDEARHERLRRKGSVSETERQKASVSATRLSQARALFVDIAPALPPGPG